MQSYPHFPMKFSLSIIFILFSNFSSEIVKNSLFQRTKCVVFLLYLLLSLWKKNFLRWSTLMNKGVHNTKCPFNSLPLLWLEQCRLFLMDVRSRFRPFDRGRYVTKCLANRYIAINYSQLSNSIGIQRRNFVTSG